MSTKITLACNDSIHLFQECLDGSNVHLKTYGSPEVRIALPSDLVGALCRSFCIDSLVRQSEITDEAIRSHVLSEVASRRGKEGLALLAGSLLYGFGENSEEEQIRIGIEHYTGMRDSLKKCVEQIHAHRLQNFTFGLEHLL